MGVSILSGTWARPRGQPVARVWGHSCRVWGQRCPRSKLRSQESTSGQVHLITASGHVSAHGDGSQCLGDIGRGRKCWKQRQPWFPPARSESLLFLGLRGKASMHDASWVIHRGSRALALSLGLTPCCNRPWLCHTRMLETRPRWAILREGTPQALCLGRVIDAAVDQGRGN